MLEERGGRGSLALFQAIPLSMRLRSSDMDGLAVGEQQFSSVQRCPSGGNAASVGS